MDNKISLKRLKYLYINKRLSASEISKIFNCSENKINFWLNYYKIKKRNISEAIYVKRNPDGDPFHIKRRFNKRELELNGLGLGIYWGEGDKNPNNTSVRLSNSDPFLVAKFREFLRKIYGVKEEKIRYGLILFNDIKESEAIKFWENNLGIKREQLGKIAIIPPQGKGTYKKKSKYGVFLMSFSNKKLKEIILKDIQNTYLPK